VCIWPEDLVVSEVIEGVKVLVALVAVVMVVVVLLVTLHGPLVIEVQVAILVCALDPGRFYKGRHGDECTDCDCRGC
jgi:hypothetical protein